MCTPPAPPQDISHATFAHQGLCDQVTVFAMLKRKESHSQTPVKRGRRRVFEEVRLQRLQRVLQHLVYWHGRRMVGLQPVRVLLDVNGLPLSLGNHVLLYHFPLTLPRSQSTQPADAWYSMSAVPRNSIWRCLPAARAWASARSSDVGVRRHRRSSLLDLFRRDRDTRVKILGQRRWEDGMNTTSQHSLHIRGLALRVPGILRNNWHWQRTCGLTT